MLRDSLRSLAQRVNAKLDDYTHKLTDAQGTGLAKQAPAELSERDAQLPVVARLMVEIRSDGSRTIARGAMEDLQHGERVSIQAEGTTPAMLAASLAKSIVAMPLLARSALKGLRDSSRTSRNDD